MVSQSELSEMLTRLNAMQSPHNHKIFIVQIDDLMSLLRMLNRIGFVFRRGQSIRGEKVNSYHVYSPIENTLGTRSHLA